LLAKVAVTVLPALIVTVHFPVPEHPLPDQPAKLEPDCAVAVRVTTVPAEKLREHVPGQLIPDPDTLPEPLPASVTDRV
jgi:hypothetical protein